MINKLKKTRIFSTIVLPLFVMLLWGSLFPLIKIGYEAFNINTSSVPDILMFAALRFTVCGVIVCGISLLKKEPIERPIGKSVFYIALMSIFAIVLHYSFTYIGLSLTDSSKTALLKQLGVLLYVCFAFLFLKEEKFSVFKIVGALIGFAGIVAINSGGGKVTFTLGNILIILASVCTVISSIMSSISVKKSSPFWITGFSQLFGGIILFAATATMGGKLPVITIKAALVFAYICTASICAYTLWYYVQRTVSLSRLFIIKFAEPLFACFFGAILLGENIFKIQYLFAFLLISAGIVIGNKN